MVVGPGVYERGVDELLSHRHTCSYSCRHISLARLVVRQHNQNGPNEQKPAWDPQPLLCRFQADRRRSPFAVWNEEDKVCHCVGVPCIA